MDLTHYLKERDALLSAAVPSLVSARRLARLTDQALVLLAEDAAQHLRPKTRWSLIALGGYGAGALLPGSDLDLLLVSNASSAKLKPFVEAILYPLWDAGLKVGHQVRSQREQIRAVRADLVTLTATLTGRTIAGDDTLGAEVLHACAADAAKRRRDVLQALWERPRPGSPYLLEPDLKDGAGGRRDFDELTWTTAVLTGAPQGDPAALVSLGLLTADEAARLESAADLVASARWELQLLGSESLMTLDAAEEMHTDAQQVQQGLADTHHVLLRTRRRVAQHGGRHDTGQMSSVDVIDLAMRGQDGLDELEQATWAGRLNALVPGYSALLVLRRPGLAHTLTVGAHCLKAATLLAEIGRNDGSPGGEIAARSARTLDDLRVPIVAALVHDVGKEVPGADHAERGAETARVAASHFGLEDHANDVAELVRLHLLLPETAAREDLDDENVILRASARIHQRELLAPLHLLTIADSLATGPAAWTGWHEALIGKLVTRLDAALSPDVDGAGIADAARIARDTALAQVPADSREAHFIRSAPERYLADRDPVRILRHGFLVASLAGTRATGTHEVDITVGPLPGSFDVTVVAIDRPGLLATIAGCFALSGLDILGVQAFTMPDGIALDAFTVHSATLADVGTDTWARFERNLSAALRDRLAIGVRLAERQRHYRQTRSAAPKVRIDTTDPYAAVVTLQVHDRLGLFYDVTRAISDSGLDIIGVTATTKHGRAVDTFRVVDRDKQVPAEGLLGMLGMRLRELGTGA